MKESRPSDIDVQRYWGILQRRRYLALAVALTVISVFTWGSVFWPKTYEASSTVFIERGSLVNPLAGREGAGAGTEEWLRTLEERITSRSIIERVIKKLGLDAHVTTREQFEGLVEGIRSKITVTTKAPRGRRGEVTDLFSISYSGSDPATVRDIVNTLVSEHIEQNLNLRRSDAYGALEFIQSQLMEYKAKLEQSDKAIREFREKNPQMIPQSETALLNRVEGYQAARIEAEIKLKELLRKRDTLQKQLSGEKELTTAFVAREGSPQSRLSYLNNQLALLMPKFTDQHPEIRKVKSEIEELKKQIDQSKDAPQGISGSETASINPLYQQLKEELAKTDAEIESLKARSLELLRQQQQAQGVLGRMPKEQEEWARLQRDRNVYQQIYDELLQKYESARVTKNLELTDKTVMFNVVDPAPLPQYPVKPNRLMLIVVGIVLGIVSGVAAAIVLENINHTYKDEESIEKSLKIPVLASIPQIITESDVRAERQRDRKVFAFAGAYLIVIGLVLLEELLYRSTGARVIHF
ncbi:MAG: XrtA system polysaccharide chain length determinant [Nitrospirota bacterium]